MKIQIRVIPVLLVLLGGLLLSACDAPGIGPVVTDEEAVEATAEVVDEAADAEAEVEPVDGAETAVPAEEMPVELETQAAPVSSVSVSEDHGIGGWVAMVAGELPDSCSFISDTEQSVAGTTIKIVVSVSRPQDMMCAQVITPYAIDVLLNTSELADGEYMVEANGVTAEEMVVIEGEVESDAPDAEAEVPEGESSAPEGDKEVAEGEEEVQRISPDSLQLELGGLADSYAWTIREGYPPSPGPGGVGMPANILLTFDGEDADQVLSDNGRYMYIFPVEAYENLVGDAVTQQVDRLQALIDEAEGRQENPEDPMPLLPPPMSFMGRWVQFLDLNTQVGPGVRYVSEAPNRQGPGAWTNLGTAYYYQGLSEDGRFYISLHWPVRTDSLPETPQDIPEDIMEQSTNQETAEQYWLETRAALDALATSEWEPDLSDLDEMIASLDFETDTPEAEEEGEEAAATPEAEEDVEKEGDVPISGQDTLLNLVSFGPVGAEEPVLDGTQIMVSLSDLQMAGLAGCNSFLADVEPQDGYFTIGELSVTLKVCEEPEGIMEQETAFLAALQGTNGFEYELGSSPTVTAAKLFYRLLDGTNGIMNFVAP